MRHVVFARARRAILVGIGVVGLLTSLAAPAVQSVVLAWYPLLQSDITGYTVHYGTGSHAYTTAIPTDHAGATITGLVEGQTYYFAVTANNALGLESAPSEELAYAVSFPPSGSFNGLFYEDSGIRPESAGAITVTVSSRGSYSGKLRIGASSYSFTGKLGPFYQATSLIKRRSAASLSVQLSIGTGSNAEKIFGQVTDGGWVAPLSGDGAVFDSKKLSAPYTGNYTLVVSGQEQDPALPAGNGFGTLRVSAAGVATLAGVLADGTKVTQSLIISRQGRVPLFVPLYSGAGLMMSWLGFANRPQYDFIGDMSWIKPPNAKAPLYPAGFSFDCAMVGSAYIAPVGLVNTMLNFIAPTLGFHGGNSGDGFASPITLGTSGKATIAGAAGFSMTFLPSQGTFSGKVMDPATGRLSSFSGAVVQKLKAGYGFLLGTNQSSEVILRP